MAQKLRVSLKDFDACPVIDWTCVMNDNYCHTPVDVTGLKVAEHPEEEEEEEKSEEEIFEIDPETPEKDKKKKPKPKPKPKGTRGKGKAKDARTFQANVFV